MNGHIDDAASTTSENPANAAWATLARGSHPIEADMAASADLGFIIEARGAGHSLTVLERTSGRDWAPLFQGSIDHPAIDPGRSGRFDLNYRPVSAPPAESKAVSATRDAVAAFEVAVRDEGLPSGLRTYARNQGFHLLLNGEWPMTLAVVDRRLSHHPLRGEFQEQSSLMSRDRTLFFAGGLFSTQKKKAATPYAELWQYDPKVCNWGLRILLLSAG